MDFQKELLRIVAIDAANRGINLQGEFKKVIEESTPDEIANTEIALVNAEYELKTLEAKDVTK